ncbi:AfsR/SARP family transcriptional regulator [Kitasatospora sp. NPDC036755]|uniref:AfsR/SARP family transcriptional regulator n=1 Tax=Kitasatospora sp. NPDC036755 TaxID=3154600 RepID=UPI0033E7A51A
MLFNVLGPIEVINSSTNVTISSARQQTILTALLLGSNQPVPLRQLVDAVWDGNPPRTATNQVRICISSLRRLLTAPGSPELIETHIAGYLLRVTDSQLDLRRYEALVGVGLNLAADHRLEEAVRHLRAALELWRGPVAAGISSRAVQVSATRLQESRLSVVEQCIDLELQLGRHREIIAELTELVATHPLHEQLRARLMLALYRSGRPAEALATFRSGRETLVAELGLDPGIELRAVEQAILTGQPSLGGLRVDIGSLPMTLPPAPEQGHPFAVLSPLPRTRLPETVLN